MSGKAWCPFDTAPWIKQLVPVRHRWWLQLWWQLLHAIKMKKSKNNPRKTMPANLKSRATVIYIQNKYKKSHKFLHAYIFCCCIQQAKASSPFEHSPLIFTKAFDFAKFIAIIEKRDPFFLLPSNWICRFFGHDSCGGFNILNALIIHREVI